MWKITGELDGQEVVASWDGKTLDAPDRLKLQLTKFGIRNEMRVTLTPTGPTYPLESEPGVFFATQMLLDMVLDVQGDYPKIPPLPEGAIA